MRLVLFLVISLIFNAFSFGQIFNKTAADTCFLPLALGNKWQYIKEYGENGYNTALEEITITKDTIIDHKQYFYFKDFFSCYFFRRWRFADFSFPLPRYS